MIAHAFLLLFQGAEAPHVTGTTTAGGALYVSRKRWKQLRKELREETKRKAREAREAIRPTAEADEGETGAGEALEAAEGGLLTGRPSLPTGNADLDLLPAGIAREVLAAEVFQARVLAEMKRQAEEMDEDEVLCTILLAA